MTLPESSWVRYTKLLSSINSTAARKYEAYLKTHETASKAGRKAAIDYAAALVQKYGESAAAVSCEMYDGIAEAAGVLVPAAEPAAVATYGEVAKTVNGMMKQEQPEETIANAIGRLVKRTGADTTLQNAKRDGAEFAWIPHGDTCSFCLMLASNGWRKASKKTIKGDHAEHIHSGCDCEFAIRFDGKPDYAGYDPEKYRAMYDNAEGDTWQEKLNSMRRDEYAANKDRINEQKRAAYARRKDTTILANTGKPDIIELEDIKVGRSVGAARKSYEIMDLKTGEMFDLIDGSHLEKVQVFAGKGTKTVYRDAYKYADDFGGEPEEWQHVKAEGYVDYYGESRRAKIHWSRHEKYGDHDYFIKDWIE